MRIEFTKLDDSHRLVDLVCQEIERIILQEPLEPGMKLPSQRELAEQLGVSRTVLREALSMLKAKGLLETKPGVGNTVRKVTPEHVSGSLKLALFSQGVEITFSHLHQVRSVLEREVARLAATHTDDEDTKRLLELTTAMEASMDDVQTFANLDADFHLALAAATHNPLLQVIASSVNSLLRQYILEIARELSIPEDVMPYHRQIMDRVADGDPQGAYQAMSEHLQIIEKAHHLLFDEQDR
jgi:GntR family transcriptional repressor for pyruvate dehydrogenase complex